ncbi:Energy-coupling factor transporter transmembrane protein EcfT [[Clostridium] ultunense Esp]|uniref:energy-coupling factor transporter transmembrane component T family protein n=1 Tax=Thermicanus aegyptius TaxID=94009 RepID=UPI0002B6FD74|nr:energy-coupling factor transporter transmembrane protein EcfT [Thermicanus aegyptius]CCQ92270.1 Energy-coupling factor transporter transmembrane protein EcfT [[Clostridium] ultunense Esp]
MAAPLELSRHITIGQYLPVPSPLHRLDPRMKLLSFMIVIIALSFNTTYVGNGIGLLFSILLFLLGKIPIRYGLSGVIPAIPFMILLAILQFFFQGSLFSGGEVYFQYGFILVTSDSLRLIIVSALRFVEIILLTSLLTLTTSTTQLAHAVERLLRPLKIVKFPAHEISLIFTIALRFVPTFAMEMEKLMKAQASRGAEFGTGAWWNIVRRTKEMFPLIIPLFHSALSRAEDLISAMEARGYMPGAKRTTYTAYTAKGSDYLALLCSILFAAFIVFLQVIL